MHQKILEVKMKKYIIDGQYVYLPLHKLVISFNQAVEEHEIDNVLSSKWAEGLEKYDNELLRKPSGDCSFERLHPYNMGILPTNECNLRCKYCYSETGEKPKQSLSKAQIRHFIHLMVKNAVLHSKIQKKRIQSKLVISGGGEPTFHWENFEYIVEYFSSECSKYNIDKKIVLITNGVMSSLNADYVIKNIDQINLSVDGFPDIQNIQRPLVNGNGSFPYVDRFIRQCEKYDKELLVRATVLQENFENMSEICRYFFDSYTNITTLHFEPLFYVGRGSRLGENHYKMLSCFLDSYIRAYQYVNRQYPNKRLYNSSFAYNLQEYFCSASLGLNPWLHMDGKILPCTDHVEGEDMVVAKISEDGIDINRSFKRMIYTLDKCVECFAYYHCGGGCPHNIEKDEVGNNLNPRSEAYCDMIAEYWKKAIISIGKGEMFCDLRPVRISAEGYENVFSAYKIE